MGNAFKKPTKGQQPSNVATTTTSNAGNIPENAQPEKAASRPSCGECSCPKQSTTEPAIIDKPAVAVAATSSEFIEVATPTKGQPVVVAHVSAVTSNGESEEASHTSSEQPVIIHSEETTASSAEEPIPKSEASAEASSSETLKDQIQEERMSPIQQTLALAVESVAEFSIAGQKLKLGSADEVAEYVEFIQKHPQIKRVFLNGNTFGLEACKALAQACDGLSLVEELNLSDCFTGRMKDEVPSSIEAFCQAFKSKVNLKKVDFSDNALGPNGARAVATLLAGNPNICEIIINNNGLGPEGGKIIAQALIDSRSLASGTPSNLVRLSIGRNRLENGSAMLLAEVIKAHSSLQSISLYQNGIRPEGIATLSEALPHCSQLLFIDLQDNTFTHGGSEAFAKAIAKLPILERLNIGDCLLGNDGCTAVIDAAVSSGAPLVLLNLQYNELNENGAMHLANKLGQLGRLEVLMLNGNAFSPVGRAAQAIKETLGLKGKADILDSWDDMEVYSETESREEALSETELAEQTEDVLTATAALSDELLASDIGQLSLQSKDEEAAGQC